jgi:hypothetical protein
MQVFTSIVQLQPGLYVMRHPGGNMPPLSIAQSPRGKGEIEVLTAKPDRGMVLEDSSDCVVMRVSEASVELLVAAFSASGEGIVPSLKVDRIALDGPEPASVAPQPAQKQLVIKDKGISIVGHVEVLGDAVAGEGEWLGNPGSTRRVEGFQLMWPDRPEGVDLAYNVVVEGVGALPVVKTGQFSGTRREAKRITEVTFALVGPNASKYELSGVAHFSGGFQIPLSSGVALSGPSGMEHLTALGLRVVPVDAARTVKKTGGVWDESARTKVFSAKSTASNTKTTIAGKKAMAKPAKTASKAKK